MMGIEVEKLYSKATPRKIQRLWYLSEVKRKLRRVTRIVPSYKGQPTVIWGTWNQWRKERGLA